MAGKAWREQLRLWQSYIEVACSYLSRAGIRVQNAGGSSTGFLLSPLFIACAPSTWVGTTHVQNPPLSSVTPVWKCPHTLTEAFLSGDSTVNHTGQGRLTTTAMLSVDGFSSLQPSMKMLLSFLLGHGGFWAPEGRA